MSDSPKCPRITDRDIRDGLARDHESAVRSRYLCVQFPDDTAWEVPAMVVARSHAAFHADETGGDIESTLANHTLPLFAEDPGEILEWATSDMNWPELAPHAVRVELPPPPPPDYERWWANFDMTLSTIHESASRQKVKADRL